MFAYLQIFANTRISRIAESTNLQIGVFAYLQLCILAELQDLQICRFAEFEYLHICRIAEYEDLQDCIIFKSTYLQDLHIRIIAGSANLQISI